MNGKLGVFFKKSFFATSANLLSMLTSVLLSLVMPRFVTVSDYGYWQMFVMYSGFVGFMHFGLCDGLYLYLGGKKLNELDFNKLYSVFIFNQLLQLFFAVIVISITIFTDLLLLEKITWIAIGIYIYIANTTTFFSMVLLAVNEIESYSKAMMIARSFLLLSGAAILFMPIYNKIIYIIITFLLSYVIEMFILCNKLRKINTASYSVRCIHFDYSLIKNFISVGFMLMLSNIFANLIIGSGRMMVQFFWDIEAFAKLSLAISLSMFFIAFLSAISYVLFPVLRSTPEEKISTFVHWADHFIGFAMMITMLSIVPLHLCIVKFLPSYIESITFAVYLFPACLFLAKTQILYNTFFKNIYKQNVLLVINLTVLAVAIVLYYISSINRDINAVAFSIMLVCVLRYFIMKFYADYIMKNYSYSYEILELVYIVFYIVLFSKISDILFSFFGVIFCGVYLFLISLQIKKKYK